MGATKAERELWLKVYVRDKGVCYYCEQDLHSKFSLWHSFNCDHILPQSQGGETNEDNLVLCCPSCNSLLGKFAPITKEDRKEYVLKRWQEEWHNYERYKHKLEEKE